MSNLFARDEIDEITQDLIGVMKVEYPKRPPTNENLYDYFITRVKNNLHVVLCFSPVSKSFLSSSSFSKTASGWNISLEKHPCGANKLLQFGDYRIE